MKTNRREFLKSVALSAGAGITAGCACAKGTCGDAAGAPMMGFVAPKLDTVRVGVVGLGARGGGAVRRLASLPHVEVVAIAEVRQEMIDAALAGLRELGKPMPRTFLGVEAWKSLCDLDAVDVVYNCTPWHLHVPIALYAMRAGKHAMVEVPSAFTVDDCWELVETSEKTRRHCMQLENCCYGEEEMLAFNMCRLGLFGTLTHGEAAYIHEMRYSMLELRWENWRFHWNKKHKGNQYPTHGLGPVAQYMGINRGDRFKRLVSLESDPIAIPEWQREHYVPGHPKRETKFDMGDMNVTMIKTARGRSIMVQHDVINPRPYSRLNVVQGTKGMLMGYPLRIYLQGQLPGISEEEPLTIRHAFDEKKTEEYRRLYMHPLWKRAGEIAKKVGGHGGMDYMMDLRWTHCLRKGMPLDMSVYDLASWCSVCELSERSVRSGNMPQEFPDFTRGAWKTAEPLGLIDVEV